MRLKVAVDMDHTLDFPEVREMVNTLFEAGHEIIVLTSPQTRVSGELVNTPRPWREKVLELWGVKYTSLMMGDGRMDLKDLAEYKGRVCKEYGVSIFIEDRPDFIAAVQAWSPGTRCLGVIQ